MLKVPPLLCKQGLCHTVALPFAFQSILRQKEELWKLKYFTMQKYTLRKTLWKKPKSFKIWRVRFYLESRSKNEGFPILCLSLTRILALVKMGLGVVVVMVDLHLKQVLNWPMTKMWVKMLRKVYELKQRDGSSINSSNSNKIKKIGLLKAKWQLCGFFSNSMIKSAFVNCFKFQWMRCILCH